MGKSKSSKAAEANAKELARLSGWLKQGPKVGLQAAVLRAHSSVMQSTHMGGPMTHDSSNAAFNWRIVVGGSATETYYKGIHPVGNSWDKRTESGDTSAIIAVITERLQQDASLLDQAIWGGIGATSVKLANPISGSYAENAGLQEATTTWHTEASHAAEQALKRWESSGPNVDWSRFGKEFI